MKRFFRKLHLWLSIPAGVFITIVCFTGALLVFEEELTVAANRAAYYTDPQGRGTLPMGELMPLVNAQLPDTVNVSGVQIFDNPYRTYIGILSGRGQRTVLIDPYTATIVDHDGVKSYAFFSWVKNLHRSLMFKGGNRNAGRLVVGITSLALVVILLAGIVIWLPKNRKGLKSRLSIRVRSGWRWFWYDLHVAGGIYATLFLLLMALTGLTWSFRWYHDTVYKAFGVNITATEKKEASVAEPIKEPESHPAESWAEKKKVPDAAPKTPPRPKAVNYQAWDVVMDSLSRAGVGFRTMAIQNRSVTLTSGKAIRSSRATDRYSFDTKTGEIKSLKPFSEQSKSNRLNAWIFSLHTGEWGGFATKCLAFIAALIGAALPATGYYLYLRRLQKRKKKL